MVLAAAAVAAVGSTTDDCFQLINSVKRQTRGQYLRARGQRFGVCRMRLDCNRPGKCLCGKSTTEGAYCSCVR